MHEGERGRHGAGGAHDGTEADVGVGRVDDFLGEPGEVFADEFLEGEFEGGLELLAVAEDADEADGVGAEDVGVFGAELAVAQEKAVDAFGAELAGEAEGFAEGQARAFLLDAEGEAALDEVGYAVDGLCGVVVVTHELLDAGEQVAAVVAEVERELGLGGQIEEIGRPFAHIVELVAGAQEEVVGALDALGVAPAQIVLGDEFVEVADAQADARHPEGVLVIAETADAVLDVGFLDEGGVAVFCAAGALVEESGGDVLGGAFVGGEVGVGAVKLFVQGGVAGEEAGFEEGGLGLVIAAGLGEDDGDGACGVTDFEAAVPENVEGFVGEVFEEGFHGLRARGGLVKKHEVDVAEGAELGATVAAQGDQGDAGRGGAVGTDVAVDRIVEQVPEHHIDHAGAFAGDFQSGGAGIVAHADHRAFQAQKGLTGGDACSGGGVGRKIKPVEGVLLEASVHGRRASSSAGSVPWRKPGNDIVGGHGR